MAPLLPGTQVGRALIPADIVLFVPERTEPHVTELRFSSSQGGGSLDLAIPRADASKAAPPPFAYQWSAPTEMRPHPLLVVVAAPTVSILDRNRIRERTPSRTVPEVVVVRVQDPAVVPPIGNDIRLSFLLRTTQVSGYEDEEVLIEGANAVSPRAFRIEGRYGEEIIFEPADVFRIRRMPDGVEIEQPGWRQTVKIRVPVVAGVRQEYFPVRRTIPVFDADVRFAYELLPRGEDGRSEPFLKIVKTRDVEVRVKRERLPLARFQTQAPSPPKFWQTWEVDDPRDVPVQGTQLVPTDRWRRTLPFEDEPLEEFFARASLDMAVGMIPVVGDIVDIGEFLYAAVTRQDRWGRPVGDADLSLMAMGAMLPFVSSSVLRNGRRMFGFFGEHADEAARIAEQIATQGRLTSAEVKLIKQMDELVRGGQRPTAAMWTSYSAVVKRIGGEPLALGDLLNAKRTGFVHAELQDAYQAYSQGALRRGGAVADPINWARRTSRGPRRLLESLLGADFAATAKRARDVPMRLDNVPHPQRYREAAAFNADLDIVRKSPTKLWERLSRFLDELTQGRAAGRLVTIGRGRFLILKGNVAEVLSMPIQTEILKTIAAKFPKSKVVLVSGVRVRRVVKGRVQSQLFSDNVIVVVSKDRLDVKGVIEVKSGREGDAEVTEQIFEWIEGKLEEGAQVVLPRGSTMTDAAGNVELVTKDLVYTWYPRDPKTPTVVNLAAAERHRITAKGVSFLGLESEFQTTARVIPHSLDQTAEEIDFLSAVLARQRGAGSPP